jgi:hypothetical protein
MEDKLLQNIDTYLTNYKASCLKRLRSSYSRYTNLKDWLELFNNLEFAAIKSYFKWN